jgi:hypothetical protein
MVAAEFFHRCLAPLQARTHPAWFYTGDDDVSCLGRGAEFNPDDHTVAGWLELVVEEKDPANAFLPDGVHPLCEDHDRETVLYLHQAMNEWGLARLLLLSPPSGDGDGPAPGGGSHPAAVEDAPEPSRGEVYG